MATYLLDSSVIIDAINGKRQRDQLLIELVQQGHVLACCAINVTEVCAGMRTHEETRTLELLQSLEYYSVELRVARLAGLLKREYSRKGTTLAVADVTIAAVAIYHQLTLVTDNLKHYPVKELNLYPLSRSRASERDKVHSKRRPRGGATQLSEACAFRRNDVEETIERSVGGRDHLTSPERGRPAVPPNRHR